MLKKIETTKLEVGMYVKNITQKGLSLHEHEREGRITDQNTISALVKRGVKHVYIDTKQGPDSAHAIPIEITEKNLEGQIKKIAQSPKEDRATASTSLEQELSKATKLHS